MAAPHFLEYEWAELCQRLADCSAHLGQGTSHPTLLDDQLQPFLNLPTPVSYSELLVRYREAAMLAKQWQKMQRETVDAEDAVDDIIEDSFPASDPPPFGHAHA